MMTEEGILKLLLDIDGGYKPKKMEMLLLETKTTLVLSEIKLKALPKSIGMMKALEHLNIWQSVMLSDIEAVSKCTSLRTVPDLEVTFNIPEEMISDLFENGRVVFAFYRAHRGFEAEIPKEIARLALKKKYTIKDSPRADFVKYLLDLKMTQALSQVGNKAERAEEIKKWFDTLVFILKDIYDDQTLKLEFDSDSYQFLIHTKGHEPFDFNSASDGFSAILDIVADLMMRMQRSDRRGTDFNMPGIVLIDEIENHLHLEMQRKIFGYLANLFPNLQFIVTTHSPFILNSVAEAVIFDLETGTLVKDGLTNVSYSGIVESYFNANELSEKLLDKFERYKKLTAKKELTDRDLVEIDELELYLDEMPDYLQLSIAAEYERLKLKFNQREDI